MSEPERSPLKTLRPLLLAGAVFLALWTVRGALGTAPEPALAADEAGPALDGSPERTGGLLLPREDERVERPPLPDWTAAIARRVERWKAEAARLSPAVRSADEVLVSVCVRDLDLRGEACAIEAGRSLAPASNMKLVTTASALVLGGPEMEFVTPCEARGPIEGGRLVGDLVLRAGGDPLVERGPGVALEEPLAALARKLVALGLRTIEGDLVLDEGDFADPAPAPGWPDARQHWAAYCALAGGFSVNGGVLEALVTPLSDGSARVEVHPENHGLPRRYDVRATERGPLNVQVGATRAGVTVRGELPRSTGPYLAEFAHVDPVELFGSVLREELARAGLRLEGTLVRRRGVPQGETLATLRSPLAGVLAPINAESENGVADQVFLTLGHRFGGEGSRAGGERATRRALEILGVDATGFVQADGSGLSRDNRASARQIVALLSAVLEEDGLSARLFRDSLAVAGERGTLDDRMQGGVAQGRVHAKTGWISGTSALSGVLETTGGRRLAFSILVSYPREAGGLNTRCFKPMQDEIVTALVEERP